MKWKFQYPIGQGQAQPRTVQCSEGHPSFQYPVGQGQASLWQHLPERGGMVSIPRRARSSINGVMNLIHRNRLEVSIPRRARSSKNYPPFYASFSHESSVSSIAPCQRTRTASIFASAIIGNPRSEACLPSSETSTHYSTPRYTGTLRQ